VQQELTKQESTLATQNRAGATISAPDVAIAPIVQKVSPSDKTSETSSDEKSRRVNLNDKRIINGSTDVNQLVPFKYQVGLGKIFSRLCKPLDATRGKYES
jgi:ribonucleoside-diphosphate reductase beta chain